MTIRNQPNNLTNEMINQIGEEYLLAFPRNSWKFFFHHHHNLARRLQAYSDNSNTRAKWNFLIAIYKDLKNANGYIAHRIEAMFQIAFGIVIPKFVTASTVYIFKPKHIITANLQPAVNRYYYHNRAVTPPLAVRTSSPVAAPAA